MFAKYIYFKIILLYDRIFRDFNQSKKYLIDRVFPNFMKTNLFDEFWISEENHIAFMILILQSDLWFWNVIKFIFVPHSLTGLIVYSLKDFKISRDLNFDFKETHLKYPLIENQIKKIKNYIS